MTDTMTVLREVADRLSDVNTTSTADLGAIYGAQDILEEINHPAYEQGSMARLMRVAPLRKAVRLLDGVSLDACTPGSRDIIRNATADLETLIRHIETGRGRAGA